MNFFKTTLVLLMLATAIFNTGCTIPVCCAPQPDIPLMHPETVKRTELIEHSLELFAGRKFERLTTLYANETRSQFKAEMQKKEPQLSDGEIKKYVDGMRKYHFSNEVKVSHQQRWRLIYESESAHGKYIVYTVVKENGEYRIVDLNVASMPS